ncbi:MAG: serine/threonine protein kinase [Myxococcales bacterium]|nr:protein kinase [Myxococcales bacterium]
MQAPERTWSSLGPALRLVGLVLIVAAAQSARGLWVSLAAILTGAGAPPLPTVADAVVGLAAIAAGAFFLRHADENAQALAGGGRVLPPLTLVRLVQPRFEHPLRELWSRSDPGAPLLPMPESRIFGALWGAGLAIAIPLWAFALLAGVEGRMALLLDGLHHVAIGAACLTALHFAAAMARRQEEAWPRLRPSVMPSPLRIVSPKTQPAPVAKAPPPPPPASPNRRTSPPPAVRVEKPPPAVCAICRAALIGRRCEACGAPALAGPFRVLQGLGGTGARRTYLAESAEGTHVVLKELSVATAPDAQSLEAFTREARTLRELKHPRLPAYVDAFREEDGPRARLYLAYRYLEGISLNKEMEDRRYTEEEVLDLVEEVLEILRHLHGLQPPLIHRDLKPSNLIRRADGTIAVIDFGVARDLDRTVQSGTLVGTVGYMPPEQLAGQVDLTCDLYALGATALHLLTRVPPWEFMDGPELRLPKLATAPVARALLKRMLAPRRAQRFSSAREALAAVKRLRSGGLRLPKTALAAAGVAAATVVAAGLGAGRRVGALPPPAHPVAQARPAEARAVKPAPLAIPPVPLVAPRAGPVYWKGGALTRAEIEASLRQLPPWLKSDQPWWIQQHVVALAKRRLLAVEAERRGLTAAGPDKERSLVRALLAAEVRKEGDMNPARALRKTWDRLAEPLFKAAAVRLNEGEIFQIEPQQLNGPLPPAPEEKGEPSALTFASRTGGLCAVEVEPELHRYGGRCESVPSLSLALLDPETLQIVDLAPGSPLPDRFYARYSDDFVESAQLGSSDGLVAAHLAERALTSVDIRIAGATGTASYSEGQSLLALSQLALRRCLAVALQAARGYTVRAKVDVELRPGSMPSARIETQPRIAASNCARVLARPELSGSGTLTVVANLSRGAPPAAEPVRHIQRSPPDEDDE